MQEFGPNLTMLYLNRRIETEFHKSIVRQKISVVKIVISLC
jgi:hypothetical protein